MPSKKIINVLIVGILIVGSVLFLRSKGQTIIKSGSINVRDDNSNITQGVNTELESDKNKTNEVFDAFIPNALLVASGAVNSADAGSSFADDSDISKFVDKVSNSLLYNIKKYSLGDLNVVKDSGITKRSYVSSVLTRGFKLAEDLPGEELGIVARSLQNNDPSILDELDPIVDLYKVFQTDLLNIKVPDSLKNKHLALINNYGEIIIAVNDMKKIISDPVSSFVAIEAYKQRTNENSDILYKIGSSIAPN